MHPEVIKLGEVLIRSQDSAKKIRQRVQTIRDKNTIASVERRDLQKRLDEQLEWFSAVANDEDSEVFIDDNNELVIVQS
ncbi:MAG: hypothetical protein PHC68_04160 [Syntrophorhabdaceae bacterium]|nr:hypothetical protein [Syntrophorhabdaceae bacterium]